MLNSLGDTMPPHSKLYGRASEVRRLNSAVDRAASGKMQFITVVGDAGSGKSGLIKNLLRQYRSILPCAAGSATPHQRFSPYQPLCDAVSQLINDAAVNAWVALSDRMWTALNGTGLAIDPEVSAPSQHVHPQDVAAILTKTGVNFKGAFLRLIKAFPERGKPLLLVLEDLHWADAASIRFIEDLFSECSQQCLVIVASYRPTPNTLPLEALAAAARHFDIDHVNIVVKPLTHEDVQALAADRFALDSAAACRIATQILSETMGNPFAIHSLLRRQSTPGDISRDSRTRGMPRNGAAEINATESAEHYWHAVIRKTDGHLQEALFALACIGRPAGTAFLSSCLGVEHSSLLGICAKAEGLGLLVRSGACWQFAHDLIGKVAYGEVQKTDKDRTLHAKVALTLYQACKQDEACIDYEVVEQLNKSACAGIKVLGANVVVRLNALAGARARRSSAYADAEHFFMHAHRASKLAGETLAIPRYAICRELGNSLGLQGKFPKAEEAYGEALAFAATSPARASVHAARALVYGAADRHKESITAGLAGLSALGGVLSLSQETLNIGEEVERVNKLRANHTADHLAALPTTTRADRLIALELYWGMFHSCYCEDEALFQVVRMRMIGECFSAGTSKFSALAFMSYATHLCCTRGDVKVALDFASEALLLTKKHPDSESIPLVLYLHDTYLLHFSMRPRAAIEKMERDLREVDAIGDPNWGSIFRFELLLRQLLVGDPLCGIADRCVGYVDYSARRAGSGPLSALKALGKLAQTLQTASALTQTPPDKPGSSTLSREWGYNIVFFDFLLAYVRGQYAHACELGDRLRSVFVEPYLPNIRAHFLLPEWCLYYGIALSRCIEKGHSTDHNIATLENLLAEMQWWAENGPQAHAGDLLALRGVVLHAKDEHGLGIAALREALIWYKAAGLTAKEAVTAEFIADICHKQGYAAEHEFFVACAIRAFKRWGIPAKVNKLMSQLDDGWIGEDLAREAVKSVVSAATAVSAAQNVSNVCTDIRHAVGTWLSGLDAAVECVFFDNEQTQEPLVESTSRTGIPEAALDTTIATQRPALIHDAARYQQLTGVQFTVDLRGKAVLCVPFLSDGIVVGVSIITASDRCPSMLNHARLQLWSVAHLVGEKVTRIRLSDTMRAELERHSRDLTDAQRRLEKFNRMDLETRIAGGFAHEMRNILSSASLLAESALADGGSNPGQLARLTRSLSQLVDIHQASSPDAQKGPARRALQQAVASAAAIEDMLAEVQVATKRGLDLTSETLEYARSGTLKNRPRKTLDVAEFLVSVSNKERTAFANDGIDLRLQVPDDKLVISVFEPDFYAVIKNLLNNARDAVLAKTDAPRREVVVALSPSNTGPVITVSDSGIGMRPEEQAQIYAPFHTTKQDGTGLGLAVVRKLVDFYEAKLSFTSTYGEGTIFHLEWPVDPRVRVSGTLSTHTQHGS